jgi:hypothetical protein
MEKCANRKTKDRAKCMTTGYACNWNAKEVTILFANNLDEVLIQVALSVEWV